MEDLKWIKKHYGERMMHLCRALFPKILETPGLLPKILKNHFCFNRTLASAIIDQQKVFEFQNHVYSFCQTESLSPSTLKSKTATQLLQEAGYTLYPECLTEEDIIKFKKFYAKGEEICSFNDGRLRTCRVWFAVKQNALSLKREDFLHPNRQDEYGTSVISIQFTKTKNPKLSIKNRYNHIVENPDNTFNSNLDNITKGLTQAFENEFGVKDTINKSEALELNGFVNVNNRFYEYNHQINNIYYCSNNTIIDGNKIIKLPCNKILIDYFIVDIQNNTISLYDTKINDEFTNSLGEIKSVSFKNNTLLIKVKDGEDVIIKTNNKRQIIAVSSSNITQINGPYLQHNTTVNHVYMPNLKKCKSKFLVRNKALTQLNLPSLESCEDYFLGDNTNIQRVHLPKLKACGNAFMYNNKALTQLNLPNLQLCEGFFLYYNNAITKVNLPKLKACGNYFLYYNYFMEQLSLPALVKTGSNFLYYNTKLQAVNLPMLKQHEDFFLASNKGAKKMVDLQK